jgi:hypothetical protein
MRLENEEHDLERIAKAFRLISKEISYGGLANALPGVAIEYSSRTGARTLRSFARTDPGKCVPGKASPFKNGPAGGDKIPGSEARSTAR